MSIYSNSFSIFKAPTQQKTYAACDSAPGI